MPEKLLYKHNIVRQKQYILVDSAPFKFHRPIKNVESVEVVGARFPSKPTDVLVVTSDELTFSDGGKELANIYLEDGSSVYAKNPSRFTRRLSERMSTLDKISLHFRGNPGVDWVIEIEVTWLEFSDVPVNFFEYE